MRETGPQLLPEGGLFLPVAPAHGVEGIVQGHGDDDEEAFWVSGGVESSRCGPRVPCQVAKGARLRGQDAGPS